MAAQDVDVLTQRPVGAERNADHYKRVVSGQDQDIPTLTRRERKIARFLAHMYTPEASRQLAHACDDSVTDLEDTTEKMVRFPERYVASVPTTTVDAVEILDHDTTIPTVDAVENQTTSGTELHENQLPAPLVEALLPHLHRRRVNTRNELDGQDRFVNVRPYVGRQGATRKFRGYQVQMKRGPRHLFLGNYMRTVTGAVVACAAALDHTLTNAKECKWWLQSMVHEAETTATWIERVVHARTT